ncbi:MAG: lipid asymmetry transporter MlaABCDEF, periplasmic component MlaD [Pseudomonadota bacterium]
MDKDIPYVKAGLFVVIALVLMVALGLFLAFKNLDTTKQTTYVILTDETVSGLTVGSSVKYHGLQVGTVTNIVISPKNEPDVADALAVYIKVDSQTPLNDTSVAVFEPAGITGQLFVNITTENYASKALAEKYNGDLVIKNSPNMLRRYALQLNDVFKNLNRIGQKVDKLLSDENIADISKTIHGTQELITKMNAQIDNLSPALASVGGAMKQGQDTLLDISATAKSITHITNTINSQMNAGVFDIRPDIEKLKNDVSKTSRDADNLIKRVDSMVLKFEMSPVEFMLKGATMQAGPGEELK